MAHAPAEGKLDDATTQEPSMLPFKSLSPRVWGPGDLAGESPCMSAADRTPSSPTRVMAGQPPGKEEEMKMSGVRALCLSLAEPFPPAPSMEGLYALEKWVT